MCRKTSRNSPRWNAVSDLFHPLLSIKINEIDWEFHEEGMDRLTRDNPESFTLGKTFTTEEPLTALRTAAGHFKVVRDLRISSCVPDHHARIGETVRHLIDSASFQIPSVRS